ncbi:MAG: 1-aminocyclopropane-1-carboxylate deaminase/D-cysteine desulfhydrase [Bacteroidia bacterium]
MKKEISYPDPYAPLEKVNFPIWNEAGLEVYFKREDLSHPFISGNKWRKLKYHLIRAIEKKHTHLLTFGGAYSNHILATAAAGAKYGFKTKGIIRGELVSNPVLNLAQLFGMDLEFISREDYRNKECLYLPENYLNTSIIPEGGAGELGEKGAGEVLNELDESFDFILCSVGTGSTFTGLLKKAASLHKHYELQGFAIIKNGEYLGDSFEKCGYQNYRYIIESHGGGYAKTSQELIQFIQLFSSQTGILCDQVYEAKMVYHFTTMVQLGWYPKGSKIAILHNGGLSGMLSLLLP